MNFLCCDYALRRFGLSAHGSAVGAFVFAFALPVLALAGHAQLGYRCAIPLAMLALHRLMSGGRSAQLAWLGVWITAQFLCAIYLGYFLLLLLGSYLVAIYLVSPSPYRRPHRVVGDLLRTRDAGFWRTLAVLGTCGVALFALFLPYVHYSHLYGFVRSSTEIDSMLPRLGSYLIADRSMWWRPFSQLVTGVPTRPEQQMFVGAVVCLLAGIGFARSRARWAGVAAMALLLLVVVTLDVGGISLYLLFEHLPLADAIRGMSRISVVMLFSLALLAGAGIDWLSTDVAPFNRIRSVAAWLLSTLLVAECVAAHASTVPLRDWRERVATLLAEVPAGLASDAILFVPRQPGVPFYMTELDCMSVAQRLGRNTINGYSGNSPPGFNLNTAPCDDLMDRLIGYVEFMKLDWTHLDQLAKHVVPIGGTLHCEVPRSLPPRTHFSGALAGMVFGQVRLHVAKVGLANAHQLRLDLVVANDAGTTLRAISDSNEPIRISWRFVSADVPTSPSKGWDTRSDLERDIPAHGSCDVRLLVDAPAREGRYRLEVSMVQESVAWFHDRGMDITRSRQVVATSRDGQISVER